ncbi:SDR family NAD(P)-dependent oxidoreductase [Acinetobacter larvae]|uniref:3-ketoacyl-ACP synthase n=1 Tax=Acinetobacter larvae TaxID=1789224 RepID=A0A1B2M384_9GAMM|nr:SDR family oxidoreductase [Acinetobacter larvae]AOA59483.1 3-ketoacyl-ACP synthase [Acinetobacter larvae]
MDLGLKGKRAVVTGGTAGIGEAIVRTLLEEGCFVAFCSRSQDNVDRLLKQLNCSTDQVVGKALDVTQYAALEAWFESLGHFDILVANVSAISADWQHSIALDMQSTIHCVETAIPYLKASKFGAITYIGSKASGFATPGFEAYGAVKAAMTHYMKSMAKKLVTEGIRVNVVAPGDTFVENGFWDNMKHAATEVYQATLDANPMGRFCTPQEIANVVAFICSPRASFVAGSQILVDGAATDYVRI